MTALNKQALRSREEFEEYYNETHAVKVTSQFKRFGYYVSPTMQKAWELWQKAQSSMRDELKSAENNLIDSECHVAELEESLRDKQALLEAAEKRIAEHSFGNRLLANADRDIKALRQRIAELEARKVNLPAACADDEYFIDGVFQALRYERDVERAIRAAGIGVKGE